jgi:hypothetical protein
MVPGVKLSITISTLAASSRNSAWPASVRMSSVMLFLPRFSVRCQQLFSSGSSLLTKGGSCRAGSPLPGMSILIDSAP